LRTPSRSRSLTPDVLGGPQPAQVTVAWLASQRGKNQALRILDVCAHPVGRSLGYLPGAVRLDWESTFASQPTFCPSPLVLASVMSQLGIGDEHWVVVCDEGHGGRALPVYRWLRRYGHQRVLTLTGGRSEWVRQQLGLVSEPAQYPASSFTVKIGNDCSHEDSPSQRDSHQASKRNESRRRSAA
ncbi:MAG TPA: rhodanese-like domain-containing protein, partial [Polyangiaceae bacterium]|nr:rhodanese-like domain-containing protein [Polyangiaceae bacterium]